ncbi:hypothetical protein [Adhaeribacter terreus]|uniref:Uncharacterized protein n=1 Tax=Adhaeribacter terreus TaxID=529703 RepID=A0ABW0ED01_9BACT
MEATCNHCDHWHQDQAKAQVQNNAFGLCDELTGQHGMDPEYVLPLVHEASKVDNTPKQFEMITGSNFGCNHFSVKRGWV